MGWSVAATPGHMATRRLDGRCAMSGDADGAEEEAEVEAIPVAAQLLHLVGGSAWLGGSLLANLFLVPFVFRQPAPRQRELVRSLLIGPERLMIGAALTVAVTGLLRGTALGPIDGLDAFGRPYGATWLAAVLMTLTVFAIGGRVTSPALSRLADDDRLWEGDDDRHPEQRRAVARRVRIGFGLELVGILAIVGSMVILQRAD